MVAYPIPSAADPPPSPMPLTPALPIGARSPKEKGSGGQGPGRAIPWMCLCPDIPAPILSHIVPSGRESRGVLSAWEAEATDPGEGGEEEETETNGDADNGEGGDSLTARHRTARTIWPSV